MSFEQPTFSFAGQPPTPTRTPTSEFDEQNAFSTPKAIDGFFDPRVSWDATESNSSGSFQKTPKAKSKELSTHAAHLLTTPNFALLSPQMPSPELPNVEEKTGSLESFIQTPPPTNSSGQKRKEKQNSVMRSHRTEGANRQILPKPNEAEVLAGSVASPIDPTPFDFGSPGLFGGNLGAVTAPADLSQRVFWDGTFGDMNLDFSSANGLFDTPKPDGLEPFVSSHDTRSTQQSFIDFQDGLASGPSPEMLTNQLAGLGGHVDPNLLFSSMSGRNITSLLDDDALQSYAYQGQGLRRDGTYAGISKSRRRRKPSVDSPAVVAALESLRDGSRKPGIRRSMTDSFVPRSGRSSSSSSRAGTSNGRTSPLKQIRADARNRKRTSVGLVIGADGRARMETIVHNPATESQKPAGMEADSVAYSSDSEMTEADEEEPDNYGALATSFGGDDFPSHSIGKSGRFSSSAGHSQKSSYSSYYSNNSDASRSKGKGTSSKRASRHLHLDPVKEGGSFEETPGSAQEADSAQQALMHSLKASQRGRYSPQKQTSGLEPFISSPGTVIDTSAYPAYGGSSSGNKGAYQ